MFIEIVIPYEPDKQLAYAYNRAVNNSKADWILFLDYDVMILNHNFYNVLTSAIQHAPSSCGWISACTNRLGPLTNIHQLLTDAPQSDDLDEHAKYSKQLYDKYEDSLVDITPLAKRVPLSGFFILTPVEVAKSIKFRGPILGCDNYYCSDLLKGGYSIQLLPGFYCYHRRKREWME